MKFNNITKRGKKQWQHLVTISKISRALSFAAEGETDEDANKGCATEEELK